MVEIRRTIRCSNCTGETNFYLSSEMPLTEILVHGRCQRCGNSLQINYSLVSDQPASSNTTTTSQSATSESGLINLDETLFEPELPSESIKELIEE